MKKIFKLVTLVLLSAVPMTVLAQGEEDAEPKGYIYATYFYCDANKADRADEIFEQISAANFDQAVKDGAITSWGWLSHHTGGLWRRLQYYTAPTLNELLDGQQATQGDPSDEEEALASEFGSICPEHEDYIWEQKSGGFADERGAAGFSVYYMCDEAREERADEIWANDFAPLLDKFVADGKFTSWGWVSHWVGGKFRRLQTLTGADHKSLLAARGELIEAMYDEANEAGAEFIEICGSHEDYMWDIKLETP
ncbi:MAG: hypothetical protein ACR2RD_03330 [Woeseiaceae bacterium]